MNKKEMPPTSPRAEVPDEASADPRAGGSATGTTTIPPQSRAESAPKPSTVTRMLALLIDAVVAWILGLLPIIGYLVSAAYFLTRDGLDVEFMRGRSLGKRVMNLRPVRLDGEKMDLEVSVRRNWMFGLGAVGALLIDLPYVGWLFIPVGIIIAFASLAIGLVEVIKVLSDAEGRRWGDHIAGTRVVQSEN